MKTILKIMPIVLGLLLVGAFIKPGIANDSDDRGHDDSEISKDRVKRGLKIAPVPLNLHKKNRALVGLGSYIVNAQGSCIDCHSCPSYLPGHNPFAGGDGQVNTNSYLAGGVAFGPPNHPIISPNLTPDAHGRPGGLSLEEFVKTIRTGRDHDTGEVLQVMPWPVLRNMTDLDLRAIYEYLKAIPHAEQPTNHCTMPGQ